MSLRSVLGGSRVKKSSKRAKSSSPSARSSPSSSSSSWTSSLPRTKSGSGARRKGSALSASGAGSLVDDDDDDGQGPQGQEGGEDYFHDKLDDYGLVKALATDLTLRDVAQAMRYILDRMFTPIPSQGAGLSSTAIASVLNYRANLPAAVSTPHVAALLSSPTAVERETAELVRAGTLRKIVVRRRRGIGEALIMSADLEGMAQKARGLEDDARAAFLRWLKENPSAQALPSRALAEGQIDQLVRAGFLTSITDTGTIMTAYSRPEDRYTMMSLQNVSQAASGSFAAVGGEGAIHASGGSGAGRGEDASPSLSLAVPGHGVLLKLVSGALEHLVDLLQKSPYREAPETLLREKWDGGIARDAAAAAKKSRGEFIGVLPGRTRKWKEFHGLAFEYVLQEAVGVGLVEVFETRSVGRGVRLV